MNNSSNAKGKVACFDAYKVNSVGLWNGENPLGDSLPLLSLQLILVVFITRVVYFLLRPLKQPRVISEIIGGIILGPSVLGRIEAFENMVFPAKGRLALDTFALFGIIFAFFTIGVKTDPSIVWKGGGRVAAIGLVGVFTPFPVLMLVSFFLRPYLYGGIKDYLSLSLLSSVLSITAFPVIIPILSEFHFLNSKLGPLAIAASLVSTACWWAAGIVNLATQAGLLSPLRALWAAASLAVVAAFVFGVFRPLTRWVIRTTPEGKPVAELYTFMILIGVLVVGFLSEMIGTYSFNGALLMGLMIPDGPPLGATLVKRTECVLSEVFLPLFYAMSGLRTDVYAIKDVNGWLALQVIMVLGFVLKVAGTMAASLWFRMSARDALTLGLIMAGKGLWEVLTYNYWWDAQMVDDQSFAILVLSTVAASAVVTPLLNLLYRPSTRYTAKHPRTILHLRPHAALAVVVCIHNQSNVAAVVNLLEASHPTPASPLVVYAIRHAQLEGRAARLFIHHRNVSRSSSSVSAGKGGAAHAPAAEPIINAFSMYEQQREGAVTVHSFTAVAPYETVHNEVCQLALEKEAVLVVVPFHRQTRADGYTEVHQGVQEMNRNILETAPCSVGILVERTIGGAMCTILGPFSYHVCILFFGGDDDREALALVSRMAHHPCVTITAVRLLSDVCIKDRSRDRKLDAEAYDDFKAAASVGAGRAAHREVVVRDMEQIVTLIQSLDIDSFDLFVVGMRHEHHPLLSGNVSSWSDFPELGVIGDLLASPDFGGATSILVVRQQVNVRLQVPPLTSSPTFRGGDGVAAEARESDAES